MSSSTTSPSLRAHRTCCAAAKAGTAALLAVVAVVVALGVEVVGAVSRRVGLASVHASGRQDVGRTQGNNRRRTVRFPLLDAPGDLAVLAHSPHSSPAAPRLTQQSIPSEG